ncbi:Non-hemolytic phospholipase C [Talaromyces pinophilus]|nr:Non-hemolytic phospholipase C [Talaromyces pinophilus]
MQKNLVALLALAAAANAGAASLKDIKHVIMLMMENRSFQHYFGTMSGVRGFADPNVQINPDGKSVWYQNLTGVTTEAEYLLPYWLNYLGGEENYNKSQCLCAGANNWIPTHHSFNGGLNNAWAQISTPQSWGYFKRQDIPYHFALAESYTVADHYHSGSINVPGGPQPLGAGGVVLDDQQANTCSGPNLDCLPLKWPAFAQYLDEAGVDWRSYQNSYNWATNNGLFYFEAFQNASTNSSLYERGLAFDGDNGLDAFKAAAAAGTLPEVSWVFPPGALQEHSPNTPIDGSWFINQVVESAINGKDREETVILLNYDEGGGWGDAVMPLISPNGTAGEWFEDPYGTLGYTFSGPGVRIPLMIISPFTRGGHVFTERSDHSSIIQFLEQYLTARGYTNIVTTQLNEWRREHMSDLVNAFDFENPDYSIPDLPTPNTPIANSAGELIGMYSGFCDIEWTGSCSGSEYVSGIPYGNQTEEDSLYFEDGFKGMRGYMTEGHYLVFEYNGYALTNDGGNSNSLAASKATSSHDAKSQRWALKALTAEGTTFNIYSAVDGRYLTTGSTFTTNAKDAEAYNITYLGSGEYAIQAANGVYLEINGAGKLKYSKEPIGFSVYSVTYHN